MFWPLSGCDIGEQLDEGDAADDEPRPDDDDDDDDEDEDDVDDDDDELDEGLNAAAAAAAAAKLAGFKPSVSGAVAAGFGKNG